MQDIQTKGQRTPTANKNQHEKNEKYTMHIPHLKKTFERIWFKYAQSLAQHLSHFNQSI